MRFSVLTLFPQQLLGALNHSISGRALDQGLIELETIQIRDYAVNDYGQVDDAPYGGGRGMVMMCEPLYQAWLAARGKQDHVRTVVLSPAGRVFDQAMARSFAEEEQIIFVCGHYEGMDQRVIEEIQAEEVSLGDFILTGGELAAAVMIDAACRLIPGVLPHQEAWELESFSDGLLEWPQYTRPSLWRDREVPAVLLSGHEAKIKLERHLMQVWETLKKKPWLLKDRPIEPSVWKLLAQRIQDQSDVEDP